MYTVYIVVSLCESQSSETQDSNLTNLFIFTINLKKKTHFLYTLFLYSASTKSINHFTLFGSTFIQPWKENLQFQSLNPPSWVMMVMSKCVCFLFVGKLHLTMYTNDLLCLYELKLFIRRFITKKEKKIFY